jgi:hypothetical protein
MDQETTSVIIASALTIFLVFRYMYLPSKFEKAKEIGYQEAVDIKEPYFLLEYEFVYNHASSKYNFRTLSEAEQFMHKAVQDNSSTTYKHYDRYEKIEIHLKGKVLKSYITDRRVGLKNIEGFDFQKYEGQIYDYRQIELDYSKLNKIFSIKLLLSDGMEVLIFNPYYSIQEDAIRFTRTKNIGFYNKSIPVLIIAEIIEMVEHKESSIGKSIQNAISEY